MHSTVAHLKKNRIIAAVRSQTQLEEAIGKAVPTVFILHSTLFDTKDMVGSLRQKNIYNYLHVDFIEGLSTDNTGLSYIARTIDPTGIISTKASVIKQAKTAGLFTIQRFFIIDSSSYATMVRTVAAVKPDMIEIMPGILPTILTKLVREIQTPVIAGGLIDTPQQVREVLSAGAIAVSTGQSKLWAYN